MSEPAGKGAEGAPRLGIRANLDQFLLQTLLVFFVSITVGLERNVVPLLAEEEFAVASTSVVLSFVVSFGFVKALLNLFGGRLSESWGRKPLLVVGWLAAVPIPLIIIWAPNWWWIVFANLLMGVNQGLAWSMTVTSKMDLVGPRWRELATGINEFAGYPGVATSALVTGYLAASYGLRPTPFYFGLAVILAALGIAVFLTRETLHHAHAEADIYEAGQTGSKTTAGNGTSTEGAPSFWDIFMFTTWRDRAMFAASQAGLLHKFTDALVWVSFPLYFTAQGLEVGEIGLIIGVYGFTWGVLQLATGPMSDRVGRKWPIVAGLLLCGGRRLAHHCRVGRSPVDRQRRGYRGRHGPALPMPSGRGWRRRPSPVARHISGGIPHVAGLGVRVRCPDHRRHLRPLELRLRVLLYGSDHVRERRHSCRLDVRDCTRSAEDHRRAGIVTLNSPKPPGAPSQKSSSHTSDLKPLAMSFSKSESTWFDRACPEPAEGLTTSGRRYSVFSTGAWSQAIRCSAAQSIKWSMPSLVRA